MYAADVVEARSAGLQALLLDPFDAWGNVECEPLPDLTALSRQIITSGALDSVK